MLLDHRNKPKNVNAIQQLVSELENHVEDFERDLTVNIDKKTGKLVLKIIDSETKETIREIPRQELVDIAENNRKSA